MSHRSILSRLAAVTLAAAVLATAPATAMPTDPQGSTTAQDERQPADKAATLDDRRGEAATGGGTDGGPVPQGPPTWPEHPTPLQPPEPRPVVVVGADDGGIDLEVPVALLILAGALALGGGLAVVGMKARSHTRAAH